MPHRSNGIEDNINIQNKIKDFINNQNNETAIITIGDWNAVPNPNIDRNPPH
jgi:hypothetical protein